MDTSLVSKIYEGALSIVAREKKKLRPELKDMSIGLVKAYVELCRRGTPKRGILDEAVKLGYGWDETAEKWVKAPAESESD